ncbi:MAG: hypothetical protein QXO75_10620 [Nitrososphaerota archaeon]
MSTKKRKQKTEEDEEKERSRIKIPRIRLKPYLNPKSLAPRGKGILKPPAYQPPYNRGPITPKSPETKPIPKPEAPSHKVEPWEGLIRQKRESKEIDREELLKELERKFREEIMGKALEKMDVDIESFMEKAQERIEKVEQDKDQVQPEKLEQKEEHVFRKFDENLESDADEIVDEFKELRNELEALEKIKEENADVEMKLDVEDIVVPEPSGWVVLSEIGDESELESIEKVPSEPQPIATAEPIPEKAQQIETTEHSLLDNPEVMNDIEVTMNELETELFEHGIEHSPEAREKLEGGIA